MNAGESTEGDIPYNFLGNIYDCLLHVDKCHSLYENALCCWGQMSSEVGEGQVVKLLYGGQQDK